MVGFVFNSHNSQCLCCCFIAFFALNSSLNSNLGGFLRLSYHEELTKNASWLLEIIRVLNLIEYK